MTPGRELPHPGGSRASTDGKISTETGVERMKVLLINPPYQTITSNLGVGHQIPLGLLMVGGPLHEDGHDVTLLDAERRRLSLDSVVREVRHSLPDMVMTGHAGSTPAHPICTR